MSKCVQNFYLYGVTGEHVSEHTDYVVTSVVMYMTGMLRNNTALTLYRMHPSTETRCCLQPIHFFPKYHT